MQEPDAGQDKRKTGRGARPLPRRRRRGRFGISMLVTLTFAGLLLGFTALSLSGRSVPVPEAVRARVEASLNGRIGEGALRLGALRLAVGRDGIPEVYLSDVRYGDSAAGAVAALNTLGVRLSPGRLLRGEVAASELALSGAQITVRRTADGEFAFRTGQAASAEPATFAEILGQLEQALDTPVLASLMQVEASGVVISLEDARSGRIWQATNANLVIRRSADALTVSAASDVFNGTDNVAVTQVSAALNRVTRRISVGATVSGMPAADIALQAPALVWLGVLDAPISGSVRTEIDETGIPFSVAGTLDIGKGALQPAEGAKPVAFESAKTYFTVDPARGRIDFSDIAVLAESGRLQATGYTYLSELDGTWPRAFLGQFAVDHATYDGEGVFAGPVDLRNLRADLRLRLQPFSVEFGQIVADNAGVPVQATARIAAGDDGWSAAIDATTDRISPGRVLAFWPLRVAPITRRWLETNVDGGAMTNVATGFRFRTGEKPDISLSFGFEDGVVRFLRDMPRITGGSGRASLHDRRFALVLDEGGVAAPLGGRLDAAGSVFAVSDVRTKPAPGEISLRARGTLAAALSVLDRRPLAVMTRAGKSPDFAEGEAEATATIRLPLKDGIKPADVIYRVAGTVRDVRSEEIVPGRVLTSPELGVEVSPEEVRVTGPADLDGVPLTADWRQPLGEKAAGGSRVSGTVALGGATVEAFGIPLPRNMVGGSGSGRYEIGLPRGAPPELTLTSDLGGVSLSLPALGWRKPESGSGSFRLDATLGADPQVRDLSVSAAGLSAEGRLDLGPGGTFRGASFDRLSVGGWLDATVSLAARGAGQPPAVTLSGGRLDLRRYNQGGTTGGAGGPVDVRLDQLIVSDGLRLQPFTGRITPSGKGLSGEFQGRVNGGTPVEGTLAPANAGTAIRIQSGDAGGVVRDAGLSPNAKAGTLDLVLTPVKGAAGGTYDGEFLIEDVRMRNAPAMAGLLDAVSVVGLLDQLRGPGILFDSVDGKFRLTRTRLTLREAAAVGGSLGISADGAYDLSSKMMDFQGVISPVYFVNGIGALLTRRGEGLFGFTYRMTGPASEPKVRVNPLSILTPGMFREIFRRKPPDEE